ncbi:MAG: outer membrane beta-barrel protein [Sphingobacteriales bacterium]|nr:outer membrane beta-barrel protein [Sphingobacteriales bacterium]
MKKTVFLTLLLLCGVFFSRAQTSLLKGQITDSVDKKNPANAVISLLRKTDSVLVMFTRARQDGQFTLGPVASGRYILMITHPYMGDYFDTLQLQAGVPQDLGKLYMTPKSKLLAEVILKTGTPIRIKGDTTVYTADSFKVRAGANVEELLRRLPGISVDKDGKITAMGERVKKVLVDGEEFFGSDPGIATRNLRADAVKEVEVFDKKSDQAEFTGIDDGVKDKTINLKMKQQKGYFGKVELGGGLRDKYNNAAMINSFKDKRKLAAYGIMSNTGQTSLDWQDAQNYGGNDNMSTGMTDDGGMWINMTRDADENFWGGRNGIPRNTNGGLHYSDKFGKDLKQSFNSGYKFSKINSDATSSVFSRTFLPDSSWLSRSNSNNYNSNSKHALNLTLDFTLDSANSLKWSARANKKNTATSSFSYSEMLTEALDSINNSRRNSHSTGDNSSFNSTLLWKHKFKKLSRTLSVNTDFNWSNSSNDGFLYSLNRYYTNGLHERTDTIDQEQVRDNSAKGISTKISYTEPLAKDFYMELSHSIAWNSNTSDRQTYEKSNNGKYEEVVDTLSNSFVFDRLVHTPGLNFRVNKKKYNFSFGASAGFSHFTQKNKTLDHTTPYNFVNFFPQAMYNYKFKPNTGLRFNYNGSTTAPSLEQLQPVFVNSDPLNIYIGNPALKQSFRHNFGTGFNMYNVLKERGIWISINFSSTQKAFVQSSSIDTDGRRTYQTVNSDGQYYLRFYSDYSFKYKKVRLGAGPTANINRNVDFINGVKNFTTTKNAGLRLNASMNKEKKFDFDLGPEFTWNVSKGSINTEANAKYWQLEGWASGRVYLPGKVEVHTELNTELRQKDKRFAQNNNFTKWDMDITKRFFKGNDLEVKLGVYDILNQNRGFDRSFSSYSFTESHFTTLRRFWLLTLTWNISKNGKPASGF